MLEVWGEGDTLEACVAAAVASKEGTSALHAPHARRACLQSTLYAASRAPHSATLTRTQHVPYTEPQRARYMAEEASFKVLVDGFGVKHSYDTQIAMIQAFSLLPFKGRVDLKVRASVCIHIFVRM